ncbi:MAG TPA: hypothetical protein VLC73_16855 [Burkholderiales bacterium]|nr:hypothetical protein [Burkholderiales bacterium]
MGDTWIADLAHFLDETGSIADMPRPAQLPAEFLARIVIARRLPLQIAAIETFRPVEDVRTESPALAELRVYVVAVRVGGVDFSILSSPNESPVGGVREVPA